MAVNSLHLSVGTGPAARDIAVAQRPGKAPGLFWLGGFRSDMLGQKALTLDRFGQTHGLAVTRFDYSGHGDSGGDFNQGSISRWLDEALAVFALTSGPQIVIGSSMGGWLALLLNRALRQRQESYQAARLKALILIAPAIDMTRDLMLAEMSEQEHIAMARDGYVTQPSAYSPEPYRINKALLDDGENHLLFGRGIETGCPVTILQGGLDPDVPRAHAEKLLTHLLTDPVTFTLIPDGDHRLSRPEDLQILARVLERILNSQ